MGGEETKIPVTPRRFNDMPSFPDTVFGFLDENYPSSGNSSDNRPMEREWRSEDEDEEDDDTCSNEKKLYWVEQEKLLYGTLYRTSSIETRVRNATKEALKQLEDTLNCNCFKHVSKGCLDCTRQGIFDYLTNLGFTCLVQISKWKSCRDIPSGEHKYLEVVEKSSPTKEVRVVIELNFKAQFEMARASKEYNNLIKKLPQVYVGKGERLRTMITILCKAAKKCMKDKKIHLAPWRKLKYIQAKWLNSYNELILTTTTTKTTTTSPPMATIFSDRMVKSRASMLTQSLIKELSISTNCQTIKVL